MNGLESVADVPAHLREINVQSENNRILIATAERERVLINDRMDHLENMQN